MEKTRKSYCMKTARGIPPALYLVHGVSCQGEGVDEGRGTLPWEGDTLIWSWLGEGIPCPSPDWRMGVVPKSGLRRRTPLPLPQPGSGLRYPCPLFNNQVQVKCTPSPPFHSCPLSPPPILPIWGKGPKTRDRDQ